MKTKACSQCGDGHENTLGYKFLCGKCKDTYHSRIARRGHLEKYYGMTMDDYDKILDRQGGVCAICKKAETTKSKLGRIKSLAVDHDHATGDIRGLLCQKCNTLLGLVEENTEIVNLALSYLHGHFSS